VGGCGWDLMAQDGLLLVHELVIKFSDCCEKIKNKKIQGNKKWFYFYSK
jgi:hypothetical protein